MLISTLTMRLICASISLAVAVSSALLVGELEEENGEGVEGPRSHAKADCGAAKRAKGFLAVGRPVEGVVMRAYSRASFSCRKRAIKAVYSVVGCFLGGGGGM